MAIALVSDDFNAVLNVLTAAGTVGAAWAAALAIRYAREMATADRHDAARRDRFTAAASLLEAFDRLQRLKVPLTPAGEVVQNPEREVQALAAEAEFIARLRTSDEPLPLTREIMFSHFPTTADLQAEVVRLGWHGNPETDSFEVMVIRGEIIEILNRNRMPRESTTERTATSGGTSPGGDALGARPQYRLPAR